jgi:hypothetical protein
MPESSATELSDLVFASLLAMFVLAVALFPLSAVLLEFYRRAVVRSMGGASGPRTARPESPPTSPSPGPVDRPVLSAPDTSVGPGELPGDDVFARVGRSRRATGAVYCVAGLVYAAVMATAMALQSNVSVITWLGLLVLFAWPVILLALQFAVLNRFATWMAGLASVVVLLTMLGTAFDLTFAIVAANLYATIIAFIVRGRRIRAVAPLVAAVLSIQLAGFAAVMGLLGLFSDARDENGVPLDFFQNGWLTLGAFLAIAASAPVLGWLTLRVAGHAYARKRASDQTITVVATWLPFVATQSLAFSYDDERWLLAGLLAFALFLAVFTAAFHWRRRYAADAAPGHRLLVLRVFALGRRSRRLFDRLAERWRYVGSVQLIAGPDLATSTVEPHEFFDFLRRRLATRFIASETEVEAHVSQIDIAPDHDGRFRVTDFFCHDHVWRTVLGRLARDSEVVLMDLRGFSQANAGCTYEIGELLNVVPLDRIVLVVDQHTDERFLSQTLAAAWERLPMASPNRFASTPTLRVFREEGWRGLDPETLLRLLCHSVAAAERPTAAQAS